MFFSFILNMLGYKISPSVFKAFDKQHIGIFPHTSKMEFCILILALLSTDLRKKICFCVAEKYMNIPILSQIIVYFGGFFVIKGSGVTLSTIEFLKKNPDKILFISPEGSLSAREWRTGFLYISKGANIPIIICGIDFSDHTFKSIDDEIYVDDVKETLKICQEKFSNSRIAPLYPECSYPRINLPKNTVTSYLPFSGKMFVFILLVFFIKIIFC